jgi:hypothetical protein
MDPELVIHAFDPLLADGLARLRGRVRPDQRDVTRIFHPTFLAICILTGTPASVDAFLRNLPANPFDVDADCLRALVRNILDSPQQAAAIKTRQETLEREIGKGKNGLTH